MITLETAGIPELQAKALKLQYALDPNAILDEAETILLNRIRTRFLDETDPDGVKWIPSKRALRDGGKTLFKTGRLFHSIQAHKLSETERAISTDVPYGIKHQLGLEGLPVRMFLGFNDDDLYVMERLVVLRVSEAIK